MAVLGWAIAVFTLEDAVRQHGLCYDGKRVRRIAASYTEFLTAQAVSGLVALIGAQPWPGHGGKACDAALILGTEPRA